MTSMKPKLLTVTGLALVLAVAAEARPPRKVVVVHTGFPIHRPLPHVVVHPPRVSVHVTVRAFLPPLVFGATVVTYRPELVIWEDAETLTRREGWTEFTLGVDGRGRELLFSVHGAAVKVNFAEVVFENGEAQVVDFNEKVVKPGTYRLLDVSGRKVDHVRMVAKAVGATSRVTLALAK
ncbi:hypothetical protein HRbin09_00280 [bacterium HR09]|nr:hypothetical protein HRbin09_00280 [bacterium HR09]